MLMYHIPHPPTAEVNAPCAIAIIRLLCLLEADEKMPLINNYTVTRFREEAEFIYNTLRTRRNFNAQSANQLAAYNASG